MHYLYLAEKRLQLAVIFIQVIKKAEMDSYGIFILAKDGKHYWEQHWTGTLIFILRK